MSVYTQKGETFLLYSCLTRENLNIEAWVQVPMELQYAYVSNITYIIFCNKYFVGPLLHARDWNNSNFIALYVPKSS